MLFIETRIRCTAAPVAEILGRACDSREFAKLRFLDAAARGAADGTRPSAAWCKAVDLYRKSDGFSEADGAFLREFGRGLGVSDVEGQLAHCRTFRGFADERLESVRQSAQNKGRLYATLGVVGGLAAALLLY